MPKFIVNAKLKLECPCPFCDGMGKEYRYVTLQDVEVRVDDEKPHDDDILAAAVEVERGDDDFEIVEELQKTVIEEIPDLPPSSRAVMQALGVPMLFDEAAL